MSESQNKCKLCPVCNGKACKNMIPGPGAKGIGDVAMRNYDKWKEIRVNMDTLCEGGEVDTSLNLFGRDFSYPFFAGPVGAVAMHYSDKYNDITYNDLLVRVCAEEGILAFTGDGIDENVIKAGSKAIKESSGMGIPTVKPWDFETIREKFNTVKEAGVFAIAMDVDAAGLPFLKSAGTSAGSKSVEQLKEIIQEANLPFIVKGIMTEEGALKAIKAGASAIVVSNHGGRVLDQCPATCEVLSEIVDVCQGRIKILVDGGIRTGMDVFKALALGADGVLLARPFANAVYGGGEDEIRSLIKRLGSELKDAMEMCGAKTLKDINRRMVRL